MMRKSTFILALVLLLGATGIWINMKSAGLDREASVGLRHSKEAPLINYQAPAFELKSIDGTQTYRVGGKRDKPVFINFWASWCGPCKLEAPDLVKIYAKYQNQLDMYAVNVTSTDNRKDAQSFVDEYGLINPILMDLDGSVFAAYNGMAFPTNLLIDKSGTIRKLYIGLRPASQIEADIEELLKEK
ncbi:TlpA family protein disulfide reductase [Paenibacillus sp. SC116]|uniref:TlpA family protein disulfide reductase n=1 Tax=Paenibacillus sp. SC116 TaxID=2968986 RepID=UPI00215A7BA6|nr:TlpA disulfide reductase family protein [Paenibacillus sp. SC116]MCR8843384.1 TlpA family protein disulfide reductase [Paenibacillus sp. SC116]